LEELFEVEPSLTYISKILNIVIKGRYTNYWWKQSKDTAATTLPKHTVITAVLERYKVREKKYT